MLNLTKIWIKVVLLLKCSFAKKAVIKASQKLSGGIGHLKRSFCEGKSAAPKKHSFYLKAHVTAFFGEKLRKSCALSAQYRRLAFAKL